MGLFGYIVPEPVCSEGGDELDERAEEAGLDALFALVQVLRVAPRLSSGSVAAGSRTLSAEAKGGTVVVLGCGRTLHLEQKVEKMVLVE